MCGIQRPQDDEQRDVKGGRLIERLIEAGERVKEQSHHSVRRWTCEREFQRKEHEARGCR